MPISMGNPETDGFVKLSLKSAHEATRKQLNTNPFFEGILVSDVAIPAGQTLSIAHGLPYTPSGYIVTKLIGGQSPTFSSANGTTIRLSNIGGTPITFDAWIF